MQSALIKTNFKNQTSFEKQVGENFIYFRLQGNLGNQLFGLSDAFSLHKRFDRQIAVDISHVIAAGFPVPEWTQLIANWDWIQVILNESLDLDVTIASMSRMTESESRINQVFYNGFRPSIEQIELSGLFTRGVFPFDKAIDQNLEGNEIALSIRLGDYQQNPHFGILPVEYYKKAITRFNDLDNPKYVIFSDDLPAAKKYLEKTKIEISREIGGKSNLSILQSLSTAKYVISSNSTFSFWGAFFSKGIVVFPDPFFLAEPNWHKGLLWESAREVRHTALPKIRYFLRLVKTYRSRHR